MAIRVRALLREWFGRGMYPTAEQFSDLFDSFFHKTEDKIPMSGVDGLTDQLNGKYSTAEGRELEKKVQKVTDDLAAHAESTEKAFEEVQNDMEALDGKIDDEAAKRKQGDEETLASARTYTDGREAAIRKDMTAGDASTLASAKAFTTEREGVLRKELQDGDAETLQAAKDHTAARETAIRKDMTDGDAATLASAKAFTTEREGVLRREQQDGDAATLASANEYTDGREAAIRKDFAAADASTLQAAKDHTAARETAIRKDMTEGDAATLSTAKAFTTEREGVLRKELQDGDTATLNAAKGHTNDREAAVRKDFAAADASTLQAAKDHTAARETAIRSDMTSGDASTLASAKEYVDKAVEQILNGSPEALDTLKELADALGNDPNFAATVTKQLGQKVDKVTGKGLSTEDYTTADKQKLAGIAAGANNYVHPSSHPATMIQEDASHRFVTDTEKSAWSGKADKTTASASAAGLMSAADKKKLDGVAAGANNYVHPDSHPATMIAQDETHRFITDAERKAWNEKPGGNMASTTAPGLMSAADKQKLDGVATGANNYVHPSSHPATMIQEDASHRFVSDTEKSAWNNKASTALASQSAAGLMSAADKKKLDGLPDGEFVLQCTIPGME